MKSTLLMGVRSRRRSRGSLRAGWVIAVAVSPGVARASTYLWTGFGSNPDYSLLTNWSGNVAPPTNNSVTTLEFASSNPNNFNPTDTLGNYDLDSIQFNQGALPFNLSGTAGKTLSIGTDGIQDLASVETISEPLDLTSAQTWEVQASGTTPVLTVSGGISGLNNLTLTGNGSVAISGTSSFNGAIIVTGGNVNFAAGGDFTYTGTNSVLTLSVKPGQPASGTVTGGTASFATINIGDGNGLNTLATFTQTAGTLSATTINVATQTADAATFVLSGSGVVNASIFNLGNGGNGVLNQSGGQLTVTQTFAVPPSGGISGTVNLSGTGVENVPGFSLGQELAPGFFNQSGGTFTSSGDINIGNGTAGTGVFILSGGTAWFRGFDAASSAVARITVSGGTLNATQLVVGSGSTATFIQTGGVVNASSGAVVGQSSGSDGTYQLSGGQLQCGTFNGGSGSGLLQFNGGTMVLTSPGGGLEGPTTTILGSGATFNTPSGVSAKVTVPLQHDSSVTTDGGLTKVGGGSLLLQSYTTYNGPTSVQSGTLVLGYGYDGTRGTISSALGVDVLSGSLQLGSAAGVNNTLGVGATPPPLTVESGASVTEFAGTTQTLGSLTLIGATVTGSGSPPSGMPDFTLTGEVAASGAADSTFSAPGGIDLSSTISFSLQAGGGTLLIASNLANAPGDIGGVNKIGRGGALILSGNDTYTGPTSINAGLIQLTPGALLPNSAVLLLNSTKLEFIASNAGSGILVRSLSSLTLQSTAQFVIDTPPNPADRQLLVINQLSFASTTASIDLTGNDLDLPGASLSTITAEISSGYGNGTWNGPGGIVSSEAAGNSTHLTALGVIQNNQSGSALFTAAHPFDTFAPGAGDVLVKYTYYGDANLDGKVDGTDYSRIDAAYAGKGALTGWFNGDFNYDGVINGSDYTLIDNAFNTQGASLSSSPAAEIALQIAASPVPEPATLALVFTSGASLLSRRRRHG